MMNKRESDAVGGGFFRRLIRSFTWPGMVFCIMPPVCWLLLFYSLVIHVRLSLGRWPAFGEALQGWPLRLHYKVVLWTPFPMVLLLYVAAAVFIVCLFLPKQRHLLIYASGYAVTAWAAAGLALLAPGPFLNWFFD